MFIMSETITDERYGDKMNQSQLKDAIVEYQRKCAKKYDVLDIDVDAFPTEISNRMTKTAGKVAHKGGEVSYVRYAYKAYEKWGWKKFAKTIRHELIHVHQVQNNKPSGHGYSFKKLVEPLDTHRHCEKFSTPNYLVTCKGCGETTGRQKKSKLVKYPHKYQCSRCGGDLVSSQN
jgi:predicted SprT family Zn-dependent metalloprotease